MSLARSNTDLNDRLQAAVVELQAKIRLHYPDAAFSVGHPEDEPTSVELTAIVDVDDPDDVLNLVIERVIDLQIDEGVPIHVVPVQTPARVVANREGKGELSSRAQRQMFVAEARTQAAEYPVS